MDGNPEPNRSLAAQNRKAPVQSPLNGATAFSIHLCAVVLATAALYFGRDFFLPVVLGLVIALALKPVLRWLATRGINESAAAVTLVLSLAIALGLGAYGLSGPATEWLEQAPQIGSRVQIRLQTVLGSLPSLTDVRREVEDLSSAISGSTAQEVVIKEPGFLATATSTVWSGITTAGIALMLATFLLASGDMVYEKIIRVAPTLQDKKAALRIVLDVEQSISRYLLTISLINTGLGAAIGCTLWAMGMPSPALFGVAAAFLNFLPYVGAIVGAALAAIIAFISLEPLWYALLVPLTYLTLTTIEGNIATPLILGRRLELNTVAIFIVVAFWGWVWGIVGVLIAVPLLVLVKTLCDHLPSWSSLGEFLSVTAPRSEVAKESEGPDLNPIVKT